MRFSTSASAAAVCSRRGGTFWLSESSTTTTATSFRYLRSSRTAEGLAKAASSAAQAMRRQRLPRARRQKAIASRITARIPPATSKGQGSSGREFDAEGAEAHWPSLSRIAGTCTWSDL